MTKNSKTQKPGWKGEAVARAPGEDAEEAADRAEGNERVRADEEAHRLRHPDPEVEGAHAHRRAHPRDPEDEIRDAAEEHRQREEEEGYPPRGKL